MNNDLISREALKEHKFVGNKYVQIGGRTNGKTLKSINKAYQQGWNDCIDAIIDNAPTVEPTFKAIATVNFDKEQLQEIVDKAKAEVLASVERPHGEWIDPQNVGANNWCSVCGEFILHYNGICNYCPNCGANMRKGEEE